MNERSVLRLLGQPDAKQVLWQTCHNLLGEQRASFVQDGLCFDPGTREGCPWRGECVECQKGASDAGGTH